jgi:lysophospholipid acyltransferase (LPLAT)-like uncharacterized protein
MRIIVKIETRKFNDLFKRGALQKPKRRWKKIRDLDVLPWIVTALMHLWFATVRVTILNQKIYDGYFKGNATTGNVVAGSWHRHAIFLFYFFRNLGPRGLMVSRSKDGELIAGVAKRLGYTPIRGSSSRGGAAALLEMINFLRDGSEKRLSGTAVDGPRGPARILKAGMLALAKESGAWFIPMACSGTRVVTISRSWDKTILPLPFSKMVIDFHEPFKIPNDISDQDMEKIRVRTERILNELTDKVDRICKYAAPPLKGKS